MDISKCIENYCDGIFTDMFALHPEMSAECSMRKATVFLQKYAMDDSAFQNTCVPVMQKIFLYPSCRSFDVSKDSFARMFCKGAEFFSYISSPLFWEDSYLLIKAICQNMGEKYIFIIEDESCEEDPDIAFKLKIPIDLNWEEFSDGGFVSDMVLNTFHNKYYVFGDSGKWGRWCDYENDWTDYEVFGFLTDCPAIQAYKKWCSTSVDGFEKVDLMKFPNEIIRNMATIW